MQEKKKLDSRCEEAIFVGYDARSPAYLVYYPDHNVVKRIRCVNFGPYGSNQPVSLQHYETLNETDELAKVEPPSNEVKKKKKKKAERARDKPKHLSDYIAEKDEDLFKIAKCAIDFCYIVVNVPNNYQEVISSIQSEQWKEAMNDGMEALKENNTYTVTNLPKGKETIGSKWVYSVKMGSNNEQRYKARLVARGFSQKEGLDYYEKFSPTAKITSTRMLLQLAVQKDFFIQQMDVKCAYLNADLDEELYLDVPDGFQVRSTDGHRVVWTLNKSLYGLKQSGKNRNSVFNTFLITHDFKQSLADPCVYSKCQNDSLIIIIILLMMFLLGLTT